MEKEIFLPVLHWFDAKNSFTGSCGDFRFLAKPNVVMATAKEVDFDEPFADDGASGEEEAEVADFDVDTDISLDDDFDDFGMDDMLDDISLDDDDDIE